MSEKILVAVDLEDEGLTGRLLGVAKEIANLHEAQVTLLSVATDVPPEVATHLPDDFPNQLSASVTERLKQLAAGLELSAGAAEVAVRFGVIYREILAEAEARGTDIIIVGSHKPDVADFLLGSNAARVVRHAGCSVFVVR